MMHPGDRCDAGQPTPGADDHLAVHLLAQDAVGGADVLDAFGGDGGGLEPEPGRAHRLGGLGHDPVGGVPPVDQRKVEADEFEVQAEQLWVQDPEGLLEQLLAGLVALEDDDGDRGLRPAGHQRLDAGPSPKLGGL